MGGSSSDVGAGENRTGPLRRSGGNGGVGTGPLPELPLRPAEEALRAGGWRRALALWGHPVVPFFSAFRGPAR